MKVKALARYLYIFAIIAALHPSRAVLAVVDLLYFIATPGSTSIVLSWETATEIDTIGFYVQRSESSAGPYTRISPLILSIGDPLTGHLYNYEDAAVQIGILYYYVLEVLNADGTSDLTIPVSAIIPAPTPTATTTATQTTTPMISPSPTPTRTPTPPFTPVLTSTDALPTSTISPTPTTTATFTPSPTTTLGSFSSAGITFPARNPTTTNPPEDVEIVENATEDTINDDYALADNGAQMKPIVVIAILLWLILALFIFLVIRYLSRGDKNQS